MEWTIEYVFSQVLVIISVIFLAITYLVKNKNIILFLSCALSIAYGLSYFLLGAYAGVFINIIGVIRGIWLYVDERKGVKNDVISLIVCSAATIVGGIFTYNIWADILVIIAGVLFTFAVWQKSIAIYRWSCLISDIIFLIYNIVLMSVVAIFTESILIIVGIFGIIKWYRIDRYCDNNVIDENKAK